MKWLGSVEVAMDICIGLIASPEVLGKDYWSIERLFRRTEIWQIAKTVGRLVI